MRRRPNPTHALNALDIIDAKLSDIHGRPFAGAERDYSGYNALCGSFVAGHGETLSTVLHAHDALVALAHAVLDRHSYQGTGEPWSDLLDQARAALALVDPTPARAIE